MLTGVSRPVFCLDLARLTTGIVTECDREVCDHFCPPQAIELDPAYQPAIDNRRILIATPAGESLNLTNMRQIEFYTEKVTSEA